MWSPFKKTLGEAGALRSSVGVRMEAIGGQGANTAGKILAEAAVLRHGYTGNHFSSFGSEKRGTPIKSFVRFSTVNLPVRSASTIQNPDVLIVFHEELLNSHPEVLNGSTEKTSLVLNTNKKAEQLKFPLGFQCKNIVTVDGTEIARKTACGLNAVMLGALTVALPEVSDESLKDVLRHFFGLARSNVSERNIRGFEDGQRKARVSSFSSSQSTKEDSSLHLTDLGWKNAPIGGVILNPGNSVLKDHSSSRKGMAPLFHKEICFNCGYCDMVCPDFCFVWDLSSEQGKGPELKGIDYQYCKGCQKCIEVCPVQALVPAREVDIPSDQKMAKAYPEIPKEERAFDGKYSSWATFADQLNEVEQMKDDLNEQSDSDS